MADKKLDTQLVNAGRSKKYTLGAVNSVIQRASSLVFDSVEAKKHATRNRANGELFYGRRGTLTHFSLQEAMCELEGGAGCVLFPCGAAAVANSILAFVEQGDHVLMTNTASGTLKAGCLLLGIGFGLLFAFMLLNWCAYDASYEICRCPLQTAPVRTEGLFWRCPVLKKVYRKE